MKFKFGKRGPKIPGKKYCPYWAKTLLWIIFVLIVLTALGCVALQRTRFTDVIRLAYQIKQQQDDRLVLAQLKKIILLPDDVSPTIAIISDADALRVSQPSFFANAKNDDRLIIYPDKAIIFDAKANKIIQVGPVQYSTQAPTFALYNGTQSLQAVTTYERKLLLVIQNAQVKLRANAVGDYDKTLIIDVTGKNSANIQAIADALSATISGLPVSEKAPEGVDYLIIIGNNG